MVPVATSSWRAVPDKFPKLACVYLPTSKLIGAHSICTASNAHSLDP
jgi:hypothetical protein